MDRKRRLRAPFFCLADEACPHFRARNIATNDRLSQRLEKNQAQRPAFDLLVSRHQLEIALRAKGRRLRRKSGALEQRTQAIAFTDGKTRYAHRKPRGENHSRSYRFAMEPAAVA